MMNNIARWINTGENGFSIHQNLNSWFFLAEEPECDLVKTWCNCQHDCFVFFPQEVFWASVDALHFPRDCIAIWRQRAWFPEPSSSTILCADDFINLVLVSHCNLIIISIQLHFHFGMHLFKSFVNIVNIYKGFTQENLTYSTSCQAEHTHLWYSTSLQDFPWFQSSPQLLSTWMPQICWDHIYRLKAFLSISNADTTAQIAAFPQKMTLRLECQLSGLVVLRHPLH